MKKNPALALTMAVAFGIGAQFVQFPSFAQGTPTLGMQSAEAGMFDSLGDSLAKAKNKAVHSAKDQAKKSVNKALGIDMNGLNSHQANLNRHLQVAAALFAGSEYQVYVATGQSENSNAAKLGMLYNSLIHGNGAMDQAYEVTSVPRLSNDNLKTFLTNNMSEQDKQKQEEVKKHMSWSKDYQAKAMFVTALAARDASFIMSESVKGFKNAKDLDDVKSKLNSFNSNAKTAMSVINFIKDNIHKRNEARKAYDKANNIKGPAKADIEKSQDVIAAM